MADIDPALGQEILDVAQRQRDFTNIITTRRITAGELLKYRNGSKMGGEIALTMSFRDYPPALGGCPACQWTATNI